MQRRSFDSFEHTQLQNFVSAWIIKLAMITIRVMMLIEFGLSYPASIVLSVN